MTVEATLSRIISQLESVPGIAGVVLGGSQARGNAHASSDIDIGIYYDESAGFHIGQLSKIAAGLDDEGRENLISPVGGWGPWVNAGGWLTVQGRNVDLILRDVHRVSRVIDECREGQISTNYHAGHPHGVLNVMYMGEAAICKPLYDPEGVMKKLIASTKPYPAKLQIALINYFRFEASFSAAHAAGQADKDDLSYVAGCCFRSVACLNQVLFALNREYCINEKKAAALVDSFSVRPVDYKARVDRIFTLLSAEAGRAGEGVSLLGELVRETEELLERHESGNHE